MAASDFYLQVKTDPDLKFRLLSFTGHEEISRLFSFELELESPRHDIKASEIIGKEISFSVHRKNEPTRFFNGFVGKFSAGTGETGFRRYQAEVVPWLWFLTQRSDCRFFSNKTVPDMLEEIFEPYTQAFFEKLAPSRPYSTWEYCVQYRETDFNFLSRLLEQEGIFYFFKHFENGHILKFGDATQSYSKEAKDIEQVHYEYSHAAKFNTVTSWQRQFRFVPGQYTQTDYNFKKHPARGEKTPATLLLTSEAAKDKPPTITPTFEIFDYPGEYDETSDGREYTKLRIEEEDVPHDRGTGTSHCQSFSPGFVFGLTEHPAKAENGDYVLVAVQHAASDFTEGAIGGQLYHNSFMCIPAAIPFRPARITHKPAIHGAQTAVVVGPPGSEINADEHGRVQVQFYWDRKGTRLQGNQNKLPTPIFIRVGQIIAGKNWGAMFIPRVGQEVIVSFLEGDPDSPIITGVVYNGEQTPAYPPKTEPTKSYIKTNSSPDGEGYNELCFEDKKGKEMLFLHAQRNMDVTVLSNSLERIHGDRHQIIGSEKDGKKSGDQLEAVFQDKHLTVKRDQVEHIGGNFKLLVGKGDASGGGNVDVVIEKIKKELIEDNSHLHVKKDLAEKVDGSQSLTVGGSLQQKMGQNYLSEAGQEIHFKAGMTCVIEAGMQLTLKVGGNFIDIGPAGISIMGTLVNINSGGAPEQGSPAQPAAAEDAEEASPTEPDTAHAHKSGQKSTPF